MTIEELHQQVEELQQQVEELQQELNEQKSFTDMYRDKWQRSDEAVSYHAKNAKLLMRIVRAQAELMSGLYNGAYKEGEK